MVVEVGATLREYSVDGVHVLDGFAEDEMCSGARGTPLMPWPNRLRDGAYEFEGHTQQVALTEPGKRNAIHGLARWRNWVPVEATPASVRMELLIHPEPGYPFALLCAAEYRLTDSGLEVTLEGRNVGTARLPYAAGHHPYIRATDEATVNSSSLRSPARTRLVVDERQIPTGERVPASFTELDPIGEHVLDVPLTDLDRDPDGLARVVLAGPKRTVNLWMDDGFPHLMLFTGDTLAAPERRRGLGVEPMTAAPNAFQSGDGLVVLKPGESHRARWGINLTP